jgi:2-polyprenyl-3-methyl-5-hydroxy-6-metoxy-1,4-benzoquinol methylase
MKEKIIELGMHPYADTFITKEQLHMSEPIYPLECILDKQNFMISLGVTTSPEERYNLYDYSYTSSNSLYSKNYWQSYYEDITKAKIIKSDSKILEIGSNDGYLLSIFKKNGFKNVCGFDSSKKMVEVAEKNKIETIHGLFNSKNSNKTNLKYDLIIANNVFNHSNDPVDFLKGVVNVLNEEGVFVFEVPYWLNTVKDFKFDQIYHEHVSYFTVKSSEYILKSIGLNIFKVEKTDYHGGSIRVYSSLNKRKQEDNILSFINHEEKNGLFDIKTYYNYSNKIQEKKFKTLEKLYKLKLSKKKIVAVGAAAKGNTLLNYYGLNNDIIDYVTDNSEFKIGKFTPLSRIPILSDEEVFSKYDEVYALILSWNISSILKKKLSKINSKIKFINL